MARKQIAKSLTSKKIFTTLSFLLLSLNIAPFGVEAQSQTPKTPVLLDGKGNVYRDDSAKHVQNVRDAQQRGYVNGIGNNPVDPARVQDARDDYSYLKIKPGTGTNPSTQIQLNPNSPNTEVFPSQTVEVNTPATRQNQTGPAQGTVARDESIGREGTAGEGGGQSGSNSQSSSSGPTAQGGGRERLYGGEATAVSNYPYVAASGGGLLGGNAGLLGLATALIAAGSGGFDVGRIAGVVGAVAGAQIGGDLGAAIAAAGTSAALGGNLQDALLSAGLTGLANQSGAFYDGLPRVTDDFYNAATIPGKADNVVNIYGDVINNGNIGGVNNTVNNAVNTNPPPRVATNLGNGNPQPTFGPRSAGYDIGRSSSTSQNNNSNTRLFGPDNPGYGSGRSNSTSQNNNSNTRLF